MRLGCQATGSRPRQTDTETARTFQSDHHPWAWAVVGDPTHGLSEAGIVIVDRQDRPDEVLRDASGGIAGGFGALVVAKCR
jgi:hypothetical protein